MISGPARQDSLSKDLIAYYKFDAFDAYVLDDYYRNPLRLMDSSQNLGSLIPSNIPPTYQADCPWPTAYCAVFSSVADSSGGGQFFTVPPINLGTMGAGAGFSVCAWFKFDVAGFWPRVFDFGNRGASALLMLAKDDSGNLQVHIYHQCGDHLTYVYGTPTLLGQWRHVCIVNQAANWTFYDNGVRDGSLESFCNFPDVVLSSNYLGRSNWDENTLLQGSIAEFRIYIKAVSASEVTAIYAIIGKPHLTMNDVCKKCPASVQSLCSSNTLPSPA